MELYCKVRLACWDGMCEGVFGAPIAGLDQPLICLPDVIEITHDRRIRFSARAGPCTASAERPGNARATIRGPSPRHARVTTRPSPAPSSARELAPAADIDSGREILIVLDTNVLS